MADVSLGPLQLMFMNFQKILNSTPEKYLRIKQSLRIFILLMAAAELKNKGVGNILNLETILKLKEVCSSDLG